MPRRRSRRAELNADLAILLSPENRERLRRVEELPPADQRAVLEFVDAMLETRTRSSRLTPVAHLGEQAPAPVRPMGSSCVKGTGWRVALGADARQAVIVSLGRRSATRVVDRTSRVEP